MPQSARRRARRLPPLSAGVQGLLERGSGQVLTVSSMAAMRAFSSHRARDIAASVGFMADLYQSGQLH